MKKLTLFLLLILFSTFIVTGCSKKEKIEKDTLLRIKMRNKIIVGVKTDSKPFGYIDENGKNAGFDIDIAKNIAKYILGGDTLVEFVSVTPDSRIYDLNSQKVDILISAMSITSARRNIVNFSNPYYQAGAALLVKKGSIIKAIEDLNGNNAGFVLGTTGEWTLRQLAPNANLRAAKSYPEILELLKKDEIDAILADDSLLYGLVDGDKNYVILPHRYTKEYYAVATRQGEYDINLLNQINSALHNMQERGILKQIKHKWLK